MENIVTCSFCGKSAKDVKKMFSVEEVAICSECIETCGSVMEKESLKDSLFIRIYFFQFFIFP